ncbi:hypothetical protein EV122DRAFT_274576 [Schizophyllum commune]
MRPRRDSQAWETGGKRARHDGEDGEVASQGIEAVAGYAERAWGRISPPFSVISEPPKARADPSSEGCKDAKALRQFSGRMWAYSVFLRTPEPPEARTGSLGEISEEGGTPTPLTALTRGQREVLRAHLSGKGLIFGIIDFANPKLPEASAGFLGEECGTDGIPHPRAGQGRRAASPLTPDLVIFTNPNPPEAYARTLGEG